MLQKILNWILARTTFRIYNSATPLGRRLGGHDIPGVTDSYIIIELSLSGITAFTGYFQTA
jgi:hypothetical protein